MDSLNIRQAMKCWDSLNLKQQLNWMRLAGARAEPELRQRLVKGDKIRATAAEYGARESTFYFEEWQGRFISSKSLKYIHPSQVYKVNGETVAFWPAQPPAAEEGPSL